MIELAPGYGAGGKEMRERGAIAIYTVLLIATVVFFSITSERSVQSEELAPEGIGPSVMINGRSFEPSLVEPGENSRMIIIVGQEDIFVGENTLEILWGNEPPSTMTAEVPAETQQH